MIVINIEGGAPAQSPNAPLSIALGNFDGVHLGHAKLIGAAAQAARRIGAKCAVWTFTANPFGAPYLTSLEERLELFESLGADIAVVCPFEEIRGLSPAGFVDLIASLGAVRCTCGYDYTFGAGAAGGVDTLRALAGGRGMECDVIGRVCLPGGETVSSTRIREYVAAGDVRAASEMLGRPYSFTYPVTHGNEIGRTLGFPTINQVFPADRVQPRRGVYVCRCLGRPAVTNVGVRPTVSDAGEVICETHIIDYSGDLYGKSVKVEFVKFIREERKFSSLSELKEQLARDAAQARGSF